MRQHFFWNSLQDQAGQVTSCNVLHVLASSQFHFYYILASSDSTSTNHLYLDPRVRIYLRKDKLVKDIITALTVKNPPPTLIYRRKKRCAIASKVHCSERQNYKLLLLATQNISGG